MKITLSHRTHGRHTPVKEADIPGDFSEYCAPAGSDDPHDFIINEALLLERLPKQFLPVHPSRCLLTVGFDWGGSGQRGLTLFRDWAKYFSAYVLELDSTAACAEVTP